MCGATEMADGADLSFAFSDVVHQSYLECRAARGMKSFRAWLVRYFVIEGKHNTLRRYKDTTKDAEADSRVYFLKDLLHIMLIEKEGTRFTLRFKGHATHDNHKVGDTVSRLTDPFSRRNGVLSLPAD